MSNVINAADMKAGDFDIHCDQVAAGQALPQLSDLIRGCPFMGNDIHMDAYAFANQTMACLGSSAEDPDHALQVALAELMFAPGHLDFLKAAAAFEAMAKNRVDSPTTGEVNAVRCHFYAAISGHRPSVYQIAAFAVTAVYSNQLDGGAVSSQTRAAVAWLLAMTDRLTVPATWTRQSAAEFVVSIHATHGPGRNMIQRMLQSRDHMLAMEVRPDSKRTTPLDAIEWAALESRWSGGSLRYL